MTPQELKAARQELGLSARGLAAALGMDGQWSDRTIRKWESGECDVPGPVATAIRLILKYERPQ